MTFQRARLSAAAAFAAGLLMSGLPAAAQQTPQMPTVTDVHESGSWAVRCYSAGPFPCDISQASFVRGKNIRVANISITMLPQTGQYYGRFVVPYGVSFSEGLTLTLGEFISPHLKFRRCERDGCYVEGILPPAMISALSLPDLKGAMSIVFVDGRKLDIPVSVNGFASGLALLKQKIAEHPAAGTEHARVGH